jgi:hypothetical protein
MNQSRKMPIKQLDTKSFREKIQDDILHRMRKHPVDLAWRKKYNIPYGSPQHLCMSRLDMFIDLEEDRLLKEMLEENDTVREEEFGSVDESLYNSGDEKKQILRISKKDVDTEYDNLDLTQFNNATDG